MRLSRRAVLLAPVVLAPAWSRPADAAPLWPGARYTHRDKARAIRRGLEFIYRTAQDENNFADYASDYLWCFHQIASATSDADLAARARDMARERGAAWRRLHPSVPENVDADDVANLVSGEYTASLIGFGNDKIKRDLQRAAGGFTARDFLRFDPTREPIPESLPDRYDVLTDAVVFSYTGERFGVLLGGRLADVLKWVPGMRPYPKFRSANDDQFFHAAYAVTHIVYALNDYTLSRLRPEWLPQEFQFLLDHLPPTIANDDAETVGEFLDTLISFGLTAEHPLIRAGVGYLLSAQHPDGSWGNLKATDVYNRFHPTWTAVNGLMDYAFAKGEGVSFPEALRAVQRPAG